MPRKILVLFAIVSLFSLIGFASAQDDDDTLNSAREFFSSGGGSAQPADPPAAAPTDVPTTPPTSAASTLTSHAGDWQTAVAELKEKGVIPDGGSLIFQENRVFANSAGSGYVSLATGSPFSDIVVAGEVTFSSNTTEFEACGLTSRMSGTTNNVNDFLVASVTNQGFGYVLDTQLPDEEGFAGFADGLDISTPHHILYIAVDGEITVYLNGELVLSGFEITDRSGFYGLGMISDPSSVTNCEASNVWAYRVSSGSEACEIVANASVNKRGGPGTNFDVAGQLAGGSVTAAVAQATDSAGFTWYELEDGSFVREDVIQAQGACASLPQSS